MCTICHNQIIILETNFNSNTYVNLERITWSNILLIPKKNGAFELSDFRPISLINGALKIIYKILASRLSLMINDLVDNIQSAFIKGRSILDNIVALEELILSVQQRHLNGHIFKVDFVKAFDMVDWEFFFDILVVRDLGSKWIS